MNISPVTLTLITLAAVVILVVTLLSKKKIVASSFTKKPLMNKAEIRLFRMLQEELPSNWTVLCQVAYGGFLANRNFGKFMSMNSKRADFVILNPLLEVTVVVEYQGSGHYGNTEKAAAVQKQVTKPRGKLFRKPLYRFLKSRRSSTVSSCVHSQTPL